MSYNITIVVAEDGTASIDEEASYLVTAPRGKFSISGHAVPEGEEGTESIGVTAPDYRISASASHSVRR